MNLLLIGLSYRTAPVEQREKAMLADSQARALLRDLMSSDAVSEAIVLSTCNRTELYVATCAVESAEKGIAAALVAHSRIGSDELACARYSVRDERAVEQLFRVASSLDSMVIGECEIQGQVRAAWQRAVEEGATGPMMNRLFRQALEVGKRVRSQTRIGTGSASASSVAVDLAQSALGDLSGSRVLVIGAGCMAESTTRALVQRGVREVVVANRTAAAARALAATVGGRGVALDCLPAELVSADIVISSTDAPGVILRHADLALAMAERTNRPMVVIDIAVPRDVDVAAADLPSVSLFDIDDLASVVAANLNGRRVEADRGEALVADAVSGFSAWRRGLSAAPVIASMRARAEAIRRGEVERLADQWEELSDADRRRVDALTKRIVNTLLHEPTVRAQAAAEGSDGEAQRHIESLRYLFGAVPRSLEGLDAAS